MKLNSINMYNQSTFGNINFQGNENRRRIGKIAATTALIVAPIVSPACIYCKKPIEKDTYTTKIEQVSYDNNIDSSRKRVIIINTNEVSEEQLKNEEENTLLPYLPYVVMALGFASLWWMVKDEGANDEGMS